MNLKNTMIEIMNEHGLAAPVEHMIANIGWQARWLPLSDQADAAKAVRLLTEALNVLTIIEAKAEADRNETKSEGDRTSRNVKARGRNRRRLDD